MHAALLEGLDFVREASVDPCAFQVSSTNTSNEAPTASLQ